MDEAVSYTHLDVYKRQVLVGVSNAGLPHDLDIDVSRLKLLKANHLSQRCV